VRQAGRIGPHSRLPSGYDRRTVPVVERDRTGTALDSF
jgi:hypothetical protein